MEILLKENKNRYVIFPIKFPKIWKAYKNIQATFWSAEEIDLSMDKTDWENKLNDDERHFIKNILAFFAGSDGIVMENLAQRFMGEIQIPEARAFYAYQIFNEQIHCVSGNTKILTDKGYFAIENLLNKDINIWNGVKFSPTVVKYTGDAQLYIVKLSNGMMLECTPNHKWYLSSGNKIETEKLTRGDTIMQYDLPILDGKDPDLFINPYSHGYSCGEYEFECKTNKKIFYVPINYSLSTRIKWLEGFLDSQNSDVIKSTNPVFLQDVQLLLTTLGTNSFIKFVHDIYNLIIYDFNNLLKSGIKPKKYIIPKNDKYHDIKIKSIKKLSGIYKTYCFTEEEKHAGIFNGILTGQSETYSLLIDTYISDPSEKDKLFRAIETIPSVEKKANWALKWIEDEKSNFATRLIAFAAVEGIFFSGSFCAIYWIKTRNLMPGLTFSNELISKDEGEHTNFAILLYSMIENKIPYDIVKELMIEAVNIEKEFIVDSIPCKLIGMNSELMSQYIEFVADRLLIQLGYKKIWNSTCPFDFMELISLRPKSNFFELRVGEYKKSGIGKNIEDRTFDDITDDF